MDEKSGPISAIPNHLGLDGRPLPVFAQPANAPIGTTICRRERSVRRTMSIEVKWPDGMDGPGHYFGSCRDIISAGPDSEPEILAHAKLVATCASRKILEISATPAPARLQELIGMAAGSQLRKSLTDIAPQESLTGAPLCLVLDDLPGATLVSQWAFSRWSHISRQHALAAVPDRNMEGVCIGFRSGSLALDENGRASEDSNTARIAPLVNPSDPKGWHELEMFDGINFRRARRIDVWRDGDMLAAECHFQDSGSAPDGGPRIAIHEYLLEARFDKNGRLDALTAQPGTLPFPECRAAPTNLSVLLGTRANELRETVLNRLKASHGCTHLNDAVRSLAEVPTLAANLRNC